MDSLEIGEFFIQQSKSKKTDYSGVKIAIHLHAYYVDIFKKYLIYFDKLPFKFDLFITTNTDDKISEIKKIIKKKKISYVKEIIKTENEGRDILPWLSIADKLNKYDIVGKFHTKKSLETDKNGEAWQQDLWGSLLENSENIINQFIVDKKLGIVISDIPQHFHINPVLATNEKIFKPILNDVWKRTGLNQYNFDDENVFIFSFGTMFWYRPKALAALTKLKFSQNEIPKEPLGVDVTILHALERLPVYIARASGYNFAISPLKIQMSGFTDYLSYNKCIMEIVDNNEKISLKNKIARKLRRRK